MNFLKDLEGFGWDSFKALVKHFAGKDNGDTKLFSYEPN